MSDRPALSSASVPLEIGERLLDEVLLNADRYFGELGKQEGWFHDSFDRSHRKHLLDLANCVLPEVAGEREEKEPHAGGEGFMRWLASGRLGISYLQYLSEIEGKSWQAQGESPDRREVLDAIRRSLESGEDLRLARKSGSACMDDLLSLLDTGLGSTWLRTRASTQRIYNEVSAKVNGSEKGNQGRYRTPSKQGFRRLQSALQMPWVRRAAVLRILEGVESELRSEDAGMFELLAPSLGKDTLEDGAPADRGDRLPAQGQGEGARQSVSSSLDGLKEAVLDQRVNSIPKDHVCFGFPFVSQRGGRWRRVELVSGFADPDISETERGVLDCTIPTIRVPIESEAWGGEQRGVVVTFEAGYEIRDLLDLELAYLAWRRADKATREAELNPAGPVLPPLRPAKLPVVCGHRDCGGDIADLNRSEDVCPHCHRLILSRCGNPDCPGEDLHLDARGDTADCPDCGQPNRNRYWQCEEHPEEGPLSRSSQNQCPACLDAIASKWESPRRGRSSGLRECPGCVAQGVAEPLLVPQGLKELAEAGEPVERNAEHRARCRFAGIPEDGSCPRCGGPLVPFGRGTAATIPCGHCGFPASAASKSCPRCRADLASCLVCASLEPRRRSARPLASEYRRLGGHDECARCATKQFSIRHALDPASLRGRVCTNLYGCSIGGALASSAKLVLISDDRIVCPVCEHPDLRPLDLSVFSSEVLKCVSCSRTMGDPRYWRTATLEQGLTVSHDGGWQGIPASSREVGRPCRVCGRGNPVGLGQDGVLELGESDLAALTLGRALWVAKSVNTARSWIARHWGDERSAIAPAAAAATLLEQTAPPWSDGLRSRLAALGWDCESAA